jgi:hypothetical protein
MRRTPVAVVVRCSAEDWESRFPRIALFIFEPCEPAELSAGRVCTWGTCDGNLNVVEVGLHNLLYFMAGQRIDELQKVIRDRRIEIGVSDDV